MRNTAWCTQLLLRNQLAIASGRILNINEMKLLWMNHRGYMCLFAIEGTQQLASWLVILMWRTG